MNTRKSAKKAVDQLVDFLNEESEAASELMDQFRHMVAELTDGTDEATVSVYVAGILLGKQKAEKNFVAQLADMGLLGDVGSLGEQLRAPSRIDDEFFGALVRLARTGLLANVRRCQVCDNWMYAQRKDKAVCSDRCRMKRHGQVPKAKERHLNYVNWRYAMGDSKEWRTLPKSKQPTFAEWLEHGKPSRDAWEMILKRRKK